MRRVIVAAASTVVGLILLLSFKTHGAPTVAAPPVVISSPATTASGSAASNGSTGSASASPSTTAGAAATPSGSTGSTQTFTGAAASTRYGPVEVQITVSNGQLTSVQAVEYPVSTGRDRQINAYAIPQLNKEALAAKSAKIDTVSGATYTSTGYMNSLQSALNKAGLA
jgi:uncharacterized protein with FMN-binding domain